MASSVLVAATLAAAGCARKPAPLSSASEPSPLGGFAATAKVEAILGDGGEGADAPRPDDNARLDELVKEHLEAAVAASPTYATWLGIHGYDDRLDDVSLEGQAREVARLHRLLDRLAAFHDAQLDENHRIDRALLEREARLGLFELTDLRPLERSPIHYADLVDSGLYELLSRDVAPLPDRLRAVVGRLLRVRGVLDEARKNLRNPPELSTRKAVELCAGTRSFIADTLPKVYTAVGDERLLADFRSAQGEALRALDEFVAFLVKDLQPRSHGDFALGGERLLEWLRLGQGIELPPGGFPASLLAIGDRELKAAEKHFDETAHLAAPGKSTTEALRLLEDDHPTAEQLLPSVATLLDQIHGFARERHLLTVPTPAPRVTEMPPYLWGYLTLVEPGPFEPRASSVLYVDPVNKSWDRKPREEHLRAFARSQMVLTVAHEGLGHFALAEAARRAPTTLQRMTANEAFVAGFAAYIDEQVLEQGFGAHDAGGAAATKASRDAAAVEDAKLRLPERRELLLLLCRFNAAIRLHAAGGKLDDAVKIFSDTGNLEDSVARREAERVAYDPGLLDAGLGYLALVKLHEDVKRKLGDAFVESEFHDHLLAHGALPLAALRRLFLPDDNGSIL